MFAMNPACAPANAPRAGLTLLELMIGLAIMVILGGMAVPSFRAMVQHHRLVAVVRQLAADMGQARQEAIARGQTVQIVFGADLAAGRWCYAMLAGEDEAPPTPCAANAERGPRLLKRVLGSDYAGVLIVGARTMRLAATGAAAGRESPYVDFGNSTGEQMRVRLTRMGRPGICAPAGQVNDTPHC